jgi:membrane-bound inhibitor of C-type lysozyme
LTKRLNLILVVAVALLVPSMILAGTNTFGVGKAVAKQADNGAANVVVVPLEISNDVPLAGLDIPLSFSEGVTLKKVDFTDTRVSYFDFKVANINNDKHTVVIGLLPQFSPASKPDLEAGNGVIANLVFEVTDPAVKDVNIKTVEMKSPNHQLTFVSHNTKDNSLITTRPEFAGVNVALSNVANGLPDKFALAQNYPNPFNPTTQISFDLPVAAKVTLDVYNVLGQRVSTLVDDNLEAGTHVVTFDGASYASGVYFYHISADNFSQTKKMVMLK